MIDRYQTKAIRPRDVQSLTGARLDEQALQRLNADAAEFVNRPFEHVKEAMLVALRELNGKQ